MDNDTHDALRRGRQLRQILADAVLTDAVKRLPPGVYVISAETMGEALHKALDRLRDCPDDRHIVLDTMFADDTPADLDLHQLTRVIATDDTSHVLRAVESAAAMGPSPQLVREMLAVQQERESTATQPRKAKRWQPHQRRQKRGRWKR